MTEATARMRPLTYAAILLVSCLVGIGAVYVTLGGHDNTQPSSKPPEIVDSAASPGAGTPVTRREPLARGDMAAFVLAKEPIPLPEIKFTGEDGKPLSLDAFKGKVVLLNLWATWCAPCRKEMPDLDRLQGALGSEKFLVVAISIDRTGVNGAKAFLDKVGVKRLEAYADETMRSSSALRVVGMPTTLLLDLDGREVGRLTGPAKWDGADAKALIGSMVVRLHRTASSTQR